MSGVLVEQLDRFAVRNSFLYALLGLHSLSRRSEALVQGAASAPSQRSDDAAPASAGDAELRLAILGVLSIARRTQSHLQAAAETTTQPVVTTPRPARQPPRDLAR